MRFPCGSLGYWFTIIGLCDILNKLFPIQRGDMKPILGKIREHGAFTFICIVLLYIIHYLLVFLLDILSPVPELEWLFHVSCWLDFPIPI